MTSSSVDLPAPLGPSTATISPDREFDVEPVRAAVDDA
jgi:hypothetical protein